MSPGKEGKIKNKHNTLMARTEGGALGVTLHREHLPLLYGELREMCATGPSLTRPLMTDPRRALELPRDLRDSSRRQLQPTASDHGIAGAAKGTAGFNGV